MKRAGRSLKASPEGINRVNKAILNFASKIDFAAELEVSRATVQSFFAGKGVARENFHKICQKLGLPWREIADLADLEDTAPEPQHVIDSSYDVDSLVKELRQNGRANIQQKCGIMRVLDMSQPIGLNDIYTSVNILEKISGRRRLEVADLLKDSVLKFDRPGLGRFEQRVSGLEAVNQHSKLMVLGKPGSGKTTFLKHIAIQCSLGEFKIGNIPVFITLKNFAEAEYKPTLFHYISEQLTAYGATDTVVAKQLLNQGKALILLDGLDEVMEADVERVLQEFRTFSAKFHTNHFVITCRIAAREYTFEQFTEVEIADFDEEQITTFATKWFGIKDPIKGEKFIKNLKQNLPLRELATNPLLLILLCLVFEESGDFPSHRAELYKEGIDTLLRKWDNKRNIEREQVYKELFIQHKEDLLSQIAWSTFERGDYFFKQQEVEQHISDYLRNLPGVDTKNASLQLDSEAVLKSIEAQHGLLIERARKIYSFSHLTFQEYFTAKQIVTNSTPQALETSLKQLVSHITEKRWYEVFLLTTSILPKADYLLQLMKQQIDNLIVQDKYLQNFLIWLDQKSRDVTTSYKAGAIRAFYLDLSLGLDIKLNPALSLALKLNPALSLALKADLELDLELDFALSLTRSLDCTLTRTLNCTLDRAISLSLNHDLQLSLQYLKAQLPDPDKGEKSFKKCWQANGESWAEELRNTQIKYRNINHNWQFIDQQRQSLQQYHDANKLLVDCLHNACYVTQTVRQEIEETLLLPLAEISQRKRLALK